MRLEHYSEAKLKSEIREIAAKYLDLSRYRIFFFGSRVSNNHSERSDIDVGIEGPAAIPGEIMVEIKEEIDNLPTLYRFDIVDFVKVSREFRKAAMANCEYVN